MPRLIGIIDYGMGNLHSVQKALESMGAQTRLTNNPLVLASCDKFVLPGVGAFDDAVIELDKRGLIAAIKGAVESKKIFLGICLGMQLLFEESLEARMAKGLNLLKGRVQKFIPKKSLKVPHIGWNQLDLKNTACPLLENIRDKSYVYFCHSYYSEPDERGVIAATCNYGIDFTSVVWKDNLYGVQFHPEKSQDVGLGILKNFVEM
ncbi:MAG: imidazole glycerol phosphate synthase subunit HisH [Candidatus Omnitrophota bacterium]